MTETESGTGTGTPWPPMSRVHVLATAAVLPTVPGRLAKTLMCLATYADHATGRVLPVRRQHDEWDITTSTWHEHIKALEKHGLVRQVTKGNQGGGPPRPARLYRLVEWSGHRTGGGSRR